MKGKIWVLLLSLAAITFSACAEADQSANSNPGNTDTGNTNTAAAPETSVKAVIVDLEKQANEAYQKKDGKFFEDHLSEDFVIINSGGRMDKATTVKMISEHKCEVKGFTISDEDVVELTDSAVLVTYKIASESTCDGKSTPSPEWAASVWVKDGDKWTAVYHQSTAAADAKGDAPESTPVATEEAKPDQDPNKDLTAEISKVDQGLWEAWTKKDGKPFEDNLTSDYLRVLPSGSQNREESIKTITTQDCTVKSFSNSNFSTKKVSDTVVFMSYLTNLDATCDGNALAKQHWSSNVYIKDGDNWRSAFFMHTPI